MLLGLAGATVTAGNTGTLGDVSPGYPTTVSRTVKDVTVFFESSIVSDASSVGISLVFCDSNGVFQLLTSSFVPFPAMSVGSKVVIPAGYLGGNVIPANSALFFAFSSVPMAGNISIRATLI
jgi:hypothetical protein